MVNDRVYVSTANSSKGLERPHVFCFLSFPLEKAFANFSNDLVMNILTVALTRAQKTVVIYVPSHTDRFSQCLECYAQCPSPSIQFALPVKKKPVCPETYVNPWDIQSMLEQCHGVTELLRQNILSFETKHKLKQYAKQFRTHTIPRCSIESFKTEEGSAFVGLLFESLLLLTWTKAWPTGACSDGSVIQHAVFQTFSGTIEQLRQKYLRYIRRNPLNSTTIFEGALLYAKLQLGTYQKIFVKINEQDSVKLKNAWKTLEPHCGILNPLLSTSGNLKTQMNVAMSFVTGIVDASIVPPKSGQDILDIIEIKASRSSQWTDQALVQSILYGIMLGRSRFRIHLFNVASTRVSSFSCCLKSDLMMMRSCVQHDVMVWNLNCFLAINVTHADPTKKNLATDGLFFVEFFNDTFVLLEMISCSRLFLRQYDMPLSDLNEELTRLKSMGHLKMLLVGQGAAEKQNLSVSTFMHMQTFLPNTWKETAWDFTKESSPMNWDLPMAHLSLQVAVLCQQVNFV
jgi:hypothetical protein